MKSSVELPGGGRASYEVVGSGRPALMFPGGPGFSADYMRPDAEMFADLLQSYLIDPHGSGKSTPPRDPVEYTPEGHAAFYEQVREALGLQDVVVFGHSFGATTGLAYCGLYPEAVSRFVCVAGSAASGSEMEEQWEKALSRHSGTEWYPAAREILDTWTERVLSTNDPTEVERMMITVLPLYTAHPERPEVERALREMDRYLTADLACMKVWESGIYQSFDLRPIVQRIECPTLVVAGELDFICGPPSAQIIADSVRDSRKVVIPDCGHIPVCESPDVYRKVVEEFLEAGS
jgi:proline iminopeptidase